MWVRAPPKSEGKTREVGRVKIAYEIQPVIQSRGCVGSIREEEIVGKLAARYEVHPSQIQAWKKTLPLLEGADGVFGGNREKQ